MEKSLIKILNKNWLTKDISGKWMNVCTTDIYIDISKVCGTHYTVWIQQYMFDVEDNSELYKLIDKLIEEAKNKEEEDFEQKQKQEAMDYLNSLV